MMNELFEVTMEKMVYGGDCLGRLPDGRAVFVPFTLPGEEVRVAIVEDKKRYAHARPIEIISPAPIRIEPRCKHFGECGGCAYQHIDYTKQLSFKKKIVIDQLKRLGGLEDPPVSDVVPSPLSWYYRNNVQFHLTQEGELGYIHADGYHILPIEECHLPQESIDNLWPQIDLGADLGVFRLGIRTDTQESLMLVMEGEDPTAPEFSVDIPISAVYTPPEANLTVMAGDDHLVYQIKDQVFQVSARSFFQINTPMAEKMVDHVLDLVHLTSDTRLIELYAGVGLFSAFLAPKVGTLTAIESSGAACHDFMINLDTLDNVILYQAEVEDVLPTLNLSPDIIIMDPPRAGLDPVVHDALIDLQPIKIVYISCDPATLARDTKKLAQKGYRLLSVTPFDVFPHTQHIECISFFEQIPED
jgi:23S rRNA (uracil1939-C5)-methyltransferase